MRIKKLISMVLSATMMMSLLETSIFADNENLPDETSSVLNGIIKTNDDVNVSNIKIDIMTSELKQSENDVFIYENTYSYSVYTDNDGTFSFSKPSENCLVKIDLNSIPECTGVDKQSYFVDYTNTLENFTISEIADVEFNDTNSVTVYDTYRNQLVTNVDVEMDTQSISMYGMTNSDNLTALCIANANGYIETASIDISNENDSLVTKANTMFAMGAISETEKAEMYLEALKTRDFGDQECITFIYDELNNYLTTGTNRTLADEIFSYIGENSKMRSSAPPEANYTTEGTRTVSNAKISYTLHYEKDSVSSGYISETLMNSMEVYVKSIIDHYFITYGFNTPMLRTGDTSYQIYFVPGLDSNGFTRRCPKTSSGEPAGSLICINYPPSINTTDDIKKTIAHEIFHSIQYAYTSQMGFTGNDKWFTEASATYAGLNYVNKYLSYGKSHANNYLASVGTPFTDISNNRSYGMFLFPQYLSQTYGGLNSIKRTLEYVSSGYPVLKSMEKSAQYSDNSATYGEIFAMFQRCNADPRRYVNSNGQYNEATRRLDNVGTASNIPVLSTSAVHYGLKASSTTSAVSVTVDITSGSYTNAMFKLVKFPGDGGSSVYVNYKPTSTSFTIYVSSFKTGTTSSVYPRLTLVASNTSDDYTTSYKFGLTRTNK